MAIDMVRGDMEPVYALWLSPHGREAVTGLMRDFKQWVRDQEPKPSVDPSLRAVRAILHDFGTSRGTVSTPEVASALAEADRIRLFLPSPLPEAERETLGRWRGNFRRRPRAEGNGTVGFPGDSPVSAVGGDRVTARSPMDILRPLTDRVRTVLQDVARTRTTITWGGLCRRLGGELPYLHPDGQGEILVVADGDTPVNGAAAVRAGRRCGAVTARPLPAHPPQPGQGTRTDRFPRDALAHGRFPAPPVLGSPLITCSRATSGPPHGALQPHPA
ncbi:hypothetical protein SAMN05192584_11628 [Streptomyces pini]|uniref:Uncharacterized protein n=1 Tax=Streptomyces pini TaxID=1520580 RepID=A0A1I4GFN5_9ACTN|nr:hypothetical protein SAMN05192584_11628 [Streptomyces pini]